MTAPDGYIPDRTNQTVLVEGACDFRSGVDAAAPVPCSEAFADAVRILAARRGATPAELAASVLLLTGGRPGEDDPGSGSAWLDARFDVGADDGTIRRALALALALADGLRPLRDQRRMETRMTALEHRNKAVEAALARIAFQPLADGVRTLQDALQLFGFLNEWCFDEDRVTHRFRELAPIYHPDTGVAGCRERMAQLLEARALLVRHVRSAYRAGRWRECR